MSVAPFVVAHVIYRSFGYSLYVLEWPWKNAALGDDMQAAARATLFVQLHCIWLPCIYLHSS